MCGCVQEWLPISKVRDGDSGAVFFFNKRKTDELWVGVSLGQAGPSCHLQVCGFMIQYPANPSVDLWIRETSVVEKNRKRGGGSNW